MKIVIASNNDHKIREIRQVFGPLTELVSMNEAGINDDIPENEKTLEGNALAKARYVYDLTGMNVIADDTGLEVKSLNSAPGVQSARYAGPAKDPGANIVKLWNELKNHDNYDARFRTVIAFILNGEEHLFEGIAEGRIIKEKRGTMGFGYDPVFIPEGYDITFAEMNAESKNSISHRGEAITKLREFIENLNQQ